MPTVPNSGTNAQFQQDPNAPVPKLVDGAQDGQFFDIYQLHHEQAIFEENGIACAVACGVTGAVGIALATFFNGAVWLIQFSPPLQVQKMMGHTTFGYVHQRV